MDGIPIFEIETLELPALLGSLWLATVEHNGLMICARGSLEEDVALRVLRALTLLLLDPRNENSR